MKISEIKNLIREVPDFPKPGIMFKDITPILSHPGALHSLNVHFDKAINGIPFDMVAGLESRGFIFGASYAHHTNKGLVLVRKPGKLPSAVYAKEYQLEYGSSKFEIHKDAIKPGQKVIIFDDLLATGGTAKTASELIEMCGGKVVGLCFLIELSFLKGRENFAQYPVYSLIQFE